MGKVKTYYTKDILKLDLAERMGTEIKSIDMAGEN